MIEKVTAETKQELVNFLKSNPVDYIYGLSYVLGFPLDDRFYKAYKFENGYLVIKENIAFIYGNLTEELGSFLDIIGVNFVYTINSPLDGFSVVSEATVMSLESVCDFEGSNIIENVNDADVYELLSSAFENFPSFESYKNTRIEQRCYLNSVTASLCVDNRTVSTASVSMNNGYSGLISFVATDINYRKNGFGGRLVSYLSEKLKKNNSIPVIIAEENKVIDLYKKIGFKESSKLFILYKEII